MNAAHTPTPWQVESIDNEGVYGDGGPDCSSDFQSFCAQDERGFVLFDTLNADTRITCVHEDHDEDGTNAWDEQGRLNIEHAVKCVNSHDALVAALRLAATALEQSTPKASHYAEPVLRHADALASVCAALAAAGETP